MIKIEPSDCYTSDLRAFCFFESCNVIGPYFLMSILFVDTIMLRMAFLVTLQTDYPFYSSTELIFSQILSLFARLNTNETRNITIVVSKNNDDRIRDIASRYNTKNRIHDIPEDAGLEFRNVTFQYEGPHSPKVLDNISFLVAKCTGTLYSVYLNDGSTVKKGQLLALVVNASELWRCNRCRGFHCQRPI